ncbi:MAG TPA: hypothetical protein VML54_08815, partial [Candidatus Limnocylindrales bacterium]|nr:hypothetical protein [Candidatus Limnocylindrales bacterium]
MTSPAADTWRAALEEALHGGSLPALDGVSESRLDGALRDLVRRHGAAAAPLVRRLADAATPKAARKVARRALYRLGQAGVELPPSSAAAITPIFRQPREQAVRAWLSGIDGSGSRAVWIVFEGGMGGERRLCSLILNDEAGI